MKLFSILQTSFNNFDNTVRTYLSKTFQAIGKEYTHNQIFGVIYDGIKGVMQNAMFYIEDALTEQNIYTATRTKSFYNLAKISGYEPFYGTASTGSIMISTFVTNTMIDGISTKLYIPNKTKIRNITTGYEYVLLMPSDNYIVDIAKPLIKHRFKCVQGTLSTGRFIAKGEDLETFSVNIADLFDKDYISIKVNGEQFEQTGCLYDMVENSKEYICQVGFDNTFEIVFGNGIHGYHLKEGDAIDIEFLVHVGEDGNILDQNAAKFEFVTQVYTSSGSSVVADNYLRLDLETPMSGGTNADTVEQVRKMIGYNSRSLVIANENNFKQFLRRFSFIGQTSILNEPNTLTITASCLRNFEKEIKTPEDYLELNTTDMLLSNQQKNMVVTSLQNSNKTFVGVNFEFQDPVIRRYSIICYVKIASNYNRDSAKTSIRNAIATYFMNLPENTLFIPKSDIVNAVTEADESIISFDFDFISELNENAFYTGYYDVYTLKLINGAYRYIAERKLYDTLNQAGLDSYGNIQLASKIEMPLLHGGFNYYPNKSDKDKTTCIRTESVQVIFI